jgi:peptide-methionine (S)-S-oxide reductase
MSRVRYFGLALILLVLTSACNTATATVAIPDPAIDVPLASSRSEQTAVFAGGCFWGIEAVFEHVKGVTDASSGYAGGAANTAHYDMVSSGTTGHAESVLVKYDPSQITYGQLLKVFFSVAHDPTQLNRQGPDVGTQYRSVIFYDNAEQKRIAGAYIDQLNQAKVFDGKIVTEVVPNKAFYKAESYHQNYAAHHPNRPAEGREPPQAVPGALHQQGVRGIRTSRVGYDPAQSSCLLILLPRTLMRVDTYCVSQLLI